MRKGIYVVQIRCTFLVQPKSQPRPQAGEGRRDTAAAGAPPGYRTITKQMGRGVGIGLLLDINIKK